MSMPSEVISSPLPSVEPDLGAPTKPIRNDKGLKNEEPPLLPEAATTMTMRKSSNAAAGQTAASSTPAAAPAAAAPAAPTAPAKEETKIMVFRGGKWVFARNDEIKDMVTWDELKYFYANIIDYVRVLMCVVAGFTVLTEYHGLSAFLILGSTLLDWIDGPVARAYGQCSIFGSGIDWTADILCQLVMMVWWVRYDASVLPWLMICTTIEVTTGFFDFATTATAKYPWLKPGQTGFWIILEWSMPEGSYTHFGTFLWLAYPFYSCGRTLEYAWNLEAGYDSFWALVFLANRMLLYVPALMYIWCEAAYGMHIISAWTEPSRKKVPDMVSTDVVEGRGGFTNFGPMTEEERRTLEAAYASLNPATRDKLNACIENKEIFWLNMWQRTGGQERPKDALDAMVTAMMEKYYADDGSVLDGYGLIVNPLDSKTQPWHLDYGVDYSSLFIPMTEIGAHNAAQYLVFPAPIPDEVFAQATRDPDNVDLSVFTANGVSYSVRQAIAPVFNVLKMDYATIHRGIANQGTDNRVVFWVSTKRNADELIPEEPETIAIDYKKNN
jgi:phosphatidylglycerophosphate synthase